MTTEEFIKQGIQALKRELPHLSDAEDKLGVQELLKKYQKI